MPDSPAQPADRPSPTPAALTGVRLDDLIAGIRTVHSDPLDQLADAMVAADHLGEVGDSLIGHFVDQARRAGASWTQIGASMGVSKQAAQKRFVPRTPPPDAAASDSANPFARFTPRTRNAIVLAHDVALATGAGEVTPTHLAHGLTADRESLAAVVLRAQDVDIDELGVPDLPDGTVETPDASTDGGSTVVPYDDGARSVLERTVQIAIEMGHNYVGTEHLLLALFEDPGVGATLTGLGADAATTRATIDDLLSQI
ncbi:Clp protease N-terminal domain-containing protein [Gordonia sinesedis]